MLPDLRIRQRDYLLEIARAITQELNIDKSLNTHILITENKKPPSLKIIFQV